MSTSPKALSRLATESDHEKELPEAPALLTPLRKHAPSPFFPGRRFAFTSQPLPPPTHGRLHWALPLPALLVALLVSALATVLLLYLLVLHRGTGAVAAAAFILVSDPTHALLGLTISTLATHTASISAPLLVSVVGYCVADTWIKEQTFPHQTRVALPTPIQYAHMVQLLVTARPASVYRGGIYLRNRRTRVPRAFRLALGLTGLVLGLSYTLMCVPYHKRMSANTKCDPQPRGRVAARRGLRRRRRWALPLRARARIHRPVVRVRHHRGHDIRMGRAPPRPARRRPERRAARAPAPRGPPRACWRALG
ncbi:hypothetical protein B0H15DRAFT_364628 [Mycena belliarum]|uniref:Uncharacterized protein n=1 Tax=Mycena belliarum TaxID=1033014 RepID=A0AAD6U0E3_9AGAR|nr:hypothetical protein B0H15DRAFT_364628 [Mycena belliae]